MIPSNLPLEKIFAVLEDQHLYSADRIAKIAEHKGILTGDIAPTKEKRTQFAMEGVERFADLNNFHDDGDGTCEAEGVGIPAWFGWRWKKQLAEAAKPSPDAPPMIFAPDELKVHNVDPHWSADSLLTKRGLFHFKDVRPFLTMDVVALKKHAKALEAKGLSPWVIMGARRIFNHWIVKMERFAPYYRKHFQTDIQKIDSKWDGNTLLKQKGKFILTEVCELIPFTPHQLRYQAAINPNAKEEFGIWRDENTGRFLVDMEKFSTWIKTLWTMQFK